MHAIDVDKIIINYIESHGIYILSCVFGQTEYSIPDSILYYNILKISKEKFYELAKKHNGSRSNIGLELSVLKFDFYKDAENFLEEIEPHFIMQKLAGETSISIFEK